jgi:tRNA(Ile)-lysidine synthase
VKKLTPPVNRSGIEIWARTERYRFFQQIKEQYGLDAVALAHTRDDQAETVLFRLLRGSGHRGLAGIPAMREGWIIRPLLECSRQEVLDYLFAKNLSYITDASNADLRFSRNKIRHVLLPLLEREFSPQIRYHLAHLAESLRQEEEWIEMQAQAAYERVREGTRKLALLRLLAESQALRPRILRIWLEQIGQIRDLNFRHLTSLTALSERCMNGEVALPGAFVVRKEGDMFLLLPKQTQGALHPASYCYVLPPGDSLTIPEAEKQIALSLPLAWNRPVSDAQESNLWQAFVDVDALSGSLAVRNMRAGDRMRPLGMQGRKKIHDIFIDQKVRARQRWPLIVCGAEILWVPGCVRGEFAKVTARTTRVFRIVVNPLPEKQKLC